MSRVLALAATIGLLTVIVVACGGESQGVAISDAYITTSSSDVAALYFTVKNHGGADTLESVSTDAAGFASFHQNVVTGASASMQPLDRVEIPADGEFAFRPGDYHVMLEGAEDPLKAGEKVEVAAHFLNAGTVNFTAVVRGVGGDTDGGEHTNHGSGR